MSVYSSSIPRVVGPVQGIFIASSSSAVAIAFVVSQSPLLRRLEWRRRRERFRRVPAIGDGLRRHVRFAPSPSSIGGIRGKRQVPLRRHSMPRKGLHLEAIAPRCAVWGRLGRGQKPGWWELRHVDVWGRWEDGRMAGGGDAQNLEALPHQGAPKIRPPEPPKP